jgi:ribonuclease-3
MMKDVGECEHRLGVVFRDASLLEQALTHSSYLNESADTSGSCNERLEFLGDAVLGMVVAERLYASNPDYQEGRLTSLRSMIVRRESLATTARKLGLGDCLRLGRGEEASGGRTKDKNLADAFEAIIGALYLDQGLEVAASFLLRHLGLLSPGPEARDWTKNYKALLQEALQARNDSLPRYSTVMAVGPDHDKEFTVEVLLDGQPIGRGSGRSKKMAEFAAARNALELLRTREE